MTTPIVSREPEAREHPFWDSPACSPAWLATRGAVAWNHPLHGPVRIRRAEVLYVRATPKRMTLLYRLDLAAGDRVWRDRLVVGVVVPPERHAQERQTRLAAARTETEPYPAVVSVPDADLLLVPYPNDRRLRIPDAPRIAAALAPHARSWGRGFDARMAEGVEVELLRYVPDKRWTARCRLGDPARIGARSSMIVKLHPEAEAAVRAGRLLETLHAATAGASRRGRLQVPRVLAIDPDLAIVATESMPGMDLERAIAVDGNLEPLGRAAAGLAGFHELGADPGRTIALGEVAGAVREAAHTGAWAIPSLGSRFARLAVAMSSSMPLEGESALVHGSFRMNHILVHRHRLAMVDLDGARRGPCEYDLANFLSSLYYLEGEGRLVPALRRRIARTFLENYAAGTRRAVSTARTLWLMAALLVEKQALKCATRPGEQRLRKTTRMVDLAERCLEAYEAIPAGGRSIDLGSMLP